MRACCPRWMVTCPNSLLVLCRHTPPSLSTEICCSETATLAPVSTAKLWVCPHQSQALRASSAVHRLEPWAVTEKMWLSPIARVQHHCRGHIQG